MSDEEEKASPVEKGEYSCESREKIDTEEEDEIIDENYKYINEFLDNVNDGIINLSNASQEKLRLLKKKFNDIPIDNDDDDKKEKEIKKKSRTLQISENTGAIPKKKNNKVVVTVNTEDENEQTASSDNISLDVSIESEYSDSNKKSKTNNKSKKLDKQRREIKTLKALMGKFDNRKVPQLEKYDEQNGENLECYLQKFENYCKESYKGNRRYWIGILEEKLPKDMLEAFRSMREVNDTYEESKERLISWHKDMTELRKRKKREEFSNIKYNKGESYYIFSVRMQKAYKIAYPKHNIETSSFLREKYMKTAPKSLRRVLSSQMVSDKVNNRTITWSSIQKCARYVDIQEAEENRSKKENNKSDDTDEEKPREIVINVGKNSASKESNSKKNTSKIYYSNNENRDNGYQSRTPRYQQYKSQPQRTPITRPPEELKNRNKTCNYCKFPGHVYETCRKRLNSCFVCGGEGHYASGCNQQRRTPRASSVPRYQQQQQSQQHQPLQQSSQPAYQPAQQQPQDYRAQQQIYHNQGYQQQRAQQTYDHLYQQQQPQQYVNQPTSYLQQQQQQPEQMVSQQQPVNGQALVE